jgi:hypothetical protein
MQDGDAARAVDFNRLSQFRPVGCLEPAADKKDVVFYELDGVRYIISPKGVGIVHGEHHRLDLPPGNYQVRVQREVGKRGVEREVYD